MKDIFEYDVFLSYSSSDEEVVKPIWQELCLSGLRVFWSDANLKSNLGEMWSKVIETSLENSRHLLLICSDKSMSSNWVTREYTAFHNSCFKPGFRKLIPILINNYSISNLPLFLRQLEAVQYKDTNSLKKVISTLGGHNIDELREENQALKKRIDELENENSILKKKLTESDSNSASRPKLVLNKEKDVQTSEAQNIDSRFEIINRKDDVIVFDRKTNLIWQNSNIPSGNVTFIEANNTIDYLNMVEYANHNDWRLPTVKEASSLFDQKTNKKHHFINDVFNNPEAVWTSDPSPRNSHEIMIINYFHKSAQTGPNSYGSPKGGVMAVRDAK